MGVALYPVEDGDKDKYEIFNVTSDVPWTPSVFQCDSRIFNTTTPVNPKYIMEDISLVSDTCTFYDPGDTELPSHGLPAKLQLDTYVTLHGHVESFIAQLSYDQLTGYDEYIDDNLGHSMDQVPQVSRNFNTFAFATKA